MKHTRCFVLALCLTVPASNGAVYVPGPPNVAERPVPASCLGPRAPFDCVGTPSWRRLAWGWAAQLHHVDRMPHAFTFNYPYQPHPGSRVWRRMEDQTWVERYPNGIESRFFILDRANIHGLVGTILVKVSGDPQETKTGNNGRFEVFIPDKGNPRMLLFYRHARRGDEGWVRLAQMVDVG